MDFDQLLRDCESEIEETYYVLYTRILVLIFVKIYVLNFLCISAMRHTCRPSGAWSIGIRRCYTHIAPLGLWVGQVQEDSVTGDARPTGDKHITSLRLWFVTIGYCIYIALLWSAGIVGCIALL